MNLRDTCTDGVASHPNRRNTGGDSGAGCAGPDDGPSRGRPRRRHLLRAGFAAGLSAAPWMLLAACGSAGATPGGSANVEVAGATAQRPAGGNAAPPAVQLPVDADTAAYRQQQALSCEAASLHTALRLLGIDLPEAAISVAEPRSEDPDEGFRGNPDANQDLADYGIHAPGLLMTIERLKAGGALPNDVRGALLHTLDEARAMLSRRQPVIVWLPLRLMAAQREPVALSSGKTTYVVKHEHTVMLYGYNGDEYLALDPFDGSRPSYPSQALAEAMRLFDDPALAIERGAAEPPPRSAG